MRKSMHLPVEIQGRARNREGPELGTFGSNKPARYKMVKVLSGLDK